MSALPEKDADARSYAPVSACAEHTPVGASRPCADGHNKSNQGDPSRRPCPSLPGQCVAVPLFLLALSFSFVVIWLSQPPGRSSASPALRLAISVSPDSASSGVTQQQGTNDGAAVAGASSVQEYSVRDGDNKAARLANDRNLSGVAGCVRDAIAEQWKEEALDEALFTAEAVHRRNLERRRERLKAAGSPLSWKDAEAWLLTPPYSCPVKGRVGGWREGGWWLCLLPSSRRQAWANHGSGKEQPYAVVVSAGSFGEASFERELSEKLGKGTFLHLLDPSISEANATKLSLVPEARVIVHRAELIGERELERARKARKGADQVQDAAFPGTVTLEVLLASMAKSRVYRLDVLKLDCGGCEGGVLQDLLRIADKFRPIFGLVLVAIHNIRDAESVTAMVFTLEALGYRMYHAEPDSRTGEGFRVGFVHQSLVLPAAAGSWGFGDNRLVAQGGPGNSLCVPQGMSGIGAETWQGVIGCVMKGVAHRREVQVSAEESSRAEAVFTTIKGLSSSAPPRTKRDWAFHLMQPGYPCSCEERLGQWGDGGKWVCLDSKGNPVGKGGTRKGAPPLRVVSVGSKGDASFESAVFQRFGPTTDTFDPTLSPEVDRAMRGLPFVRFHKAGLAGGRRYDLLRTTQPGLWLNVHGLMAAANQSFVDILKIDCEGCEVDVVQDLVRGTTATTPLFGQVLMEMHTLGNIGKANSVIAGMEKLGYRIFHSEANAYCWACYEAAFIHESLLGDDKQHQLTMAEVATSLEPCVGQYMTSNALAHHT